MRPGAAGRGARLGGRALAHVPLAAALLALAAPARAQPGAVAPGAEVAEILLAGKRALAAGEYERAAALVRPLTADPTGEGEGGARSPARIAPADRGEAWRILGLSLFFLGQQAGAEAALLELLKLDADATLDPTLVPPEAIVFFQDVRVRHDAVIRAHRPTPRIPTRWWLNLVPPGGQLQNGEVVKGFTLLGAEILFGAAGVTTFVLLRRECRSDDVFVCGDVGRGRRLKRLNHASNLLFVGALTYGVIDGFLGYRRLRKGAEPDGISVGAGPTEGGGAVWMSLDF